MSSDLHSIINVANNSITQLQMSWKDKTGRNVAKTLQDFIDAKLVPAFGKSDNLENTLELISQACSKLQDQLREIDRELDNLSENGSQHAGQISHSCSFSFNPNQPREDDGYNWQDYDESMTESSGGRSLTRHK